MRYAPSLHISGRSAPIRRAGSGPYDWTIHRRSLPVVFLTCPLLGLSEPDTPAVDVRVDGGSAAVMTPQGPAVMLSTRAMVRLHHHFQVADGAHFTYLPWQTIPLPGS